MTRFFNLESYIECCQYSEIFGKKLSDLIPKSTNSLPLAYKHFFQDYQDVEILHLPILPLFESSKLAPRVDNLPKEKLGFFVADKSEENIFIIRTANSLILRSLQSAYLFSNVFYYWSYVDEIGNFATSNQPMIIYDFDSFTPAQIIPLTFESHPQTPYPIPIIDPRNIDSYETLKLSIKYEEIYDNICTSIASIIVNNLNLDSIQKQTIARYF